MEIAGGAGEIARHGIARGHRGVEKFLLAGGAPDGQQAAYHDAAIEEVGEGGGRDFERHGFRCGVPGAGKVACGGDGAREVACVVMGQKVPVQRPRVRTVEDKEVRLGSYELFHRGEPLTETVWEKLMLGLSTRKYGHAVRQFTEAYGLEKSAVSEHFIEASRAKLKVMMESRLDKIRLCALLIDATPFEGQQMVAALGIGQDGRKTILGIRQGATENATVVGELLGDLMSRGLDFTEPRLYVLDGGKAWTAAGKRYAGDAAAIQRCQVHKRRNVLDHLTDEQKPAIAKRLNAAYALRSEEHTSELQSLRHLVCRLLL